MAWKVRTDDPKLIEEATVDAHGPAEQATGFYTMIEENVRLPVTAKAVGEDVEVTSVDLDDDGEELVAECRRRERSYSIALTELEIPEEIPGREWIAANFQFQGKRAGTAFLRTSVGRGGSPDRF